MKKLMIGSAVLAALFFGICGCSGPSAEEEAAKQKKEDSLMEIDRDNSVNEADRMLREADSLEQLRQDSLEKASRK